jgi:hypothetical protein
LSNQSRERRRFTLAGLFLVLLPGLRATMGFLSNHHMFLATMALRLERINRENARRGKKAARLDDMFG